MPLKDGRSAWPSPFAAAAKKDLNSAGTSFLWLGCAFALRFSFPTQQSFSLHGNFDLSSDHDGKWRAFWRKQQPNNQTPKSPRQRFDCGFLVSFRVFFH